MHWTVAAGPRASSGEGERHDGRDGDQRRRSTAREADEAPFVNLRDPARALGPGREAGRQPPRPDLGGRPRREVERLALAALEAPQHARGARAGPQPDRRRARGPLGARQVPGGHHALLRLAHRSRRPQRPDPPPGHPGRLGAARLHGDDGGLALRGPPLPGPRPRPPLPGPGPDAHHDPVRELLPLLHAEPDRRRPDPELQPARARGAARLHPPDAAGSRRPHLRRRWPHAGAEAPRIRPARPPRDPPRRDHPDRLPGPGLPAAADRRRALRDAGEVPPDVAQHPRQPPERDDAGARPRLRPAVPGGDPAGQPVRAAGGRQRLRPHPARPRPEARRDPGPAVLHLPVRPGGGRRPLPDAGRQGPRDHRGPARPHLRATPSRSTSSTRPAAAGRSR